MDLAFPANKGRYSVLSPENIEKKSKFGVETRFKNISYKNYSNLSYIDLDFMADVLDIRNFGHCARLHPTAQVHCGDLTEVPEKFATFLLH